MDYISLKIQNTAIYLYEKQTNPFPNWGLWYPITNDFYHM